MRNLQTAPGRLVSIGTERRDRILELADLANAGAREIRQRVRFSIECAAQAGRLLAEEREEILKQHGRGAWKTYFNAHFEAAIPVSTAYRWMAIALKFPWESIDGGEIPANVIREGFSGLQILPHKERIAIENNAALPRLHNSFPFINRFIAWRKGFKADKSAQDWSARRRDLEMEMRPIIEFLRELELI